MEPLVQKILVVGGNGFIGSAICKAALARGMQVTSISSSGRPYRTAKGHTPAWVTKVDWQAADALKPDTYAHLLPSVSGVVHTLGTLLEGGQYKRTVRDGDLFGLLGSFLSRPGGNPLESGGEAARAGSYEVMNRDAALRVCEAFVAARATTDAQKYAPRPFVFLSAEDIFRPLISARYIETKRDAEQRIETMLLDRPEYRGVYIRPSLVYHAHHRPLTSPAAALLDLSATVHSKAPDIIPTPSRVFRSLGSAFSRSDSPGSAMVSSTLYSMANCLTTPPIHVDHVADAVCCALQRKEVRGVLGVRAMRELIGWAEMGAGSVQMEQQL